MAVRKNLRHAEDVREKIQISQLTKRLENNAFGTLTTPKGEPCQMSDGQVRSAIFLIERVVPKAEAPKDLNVSGNLNLTVTTGVPSGS